MSSDRVIAMIVWNEFLNDARVLKEAQTLQAAGYQVIVHALHTPGVTREYETLPCGVKVVRVARSPFWRWRKKDLATANKQGHIKVNSASIKKLSLTKQLLRIIARTWTHLGLVRQLVRSKPNVLHSHDVNTLPTAWLASVITRVPLVYDAHEISTDREGYTGFRKLVGWVEKKLMPRTAGTITTTDIRAKFFALAYKIPRPLVLQNRPCLTHAPRTEKIREHLGLKEAWPIVLYQGGLQQGRGLELLVNVARQVNNAYFVFIGGGRLTERLRALVSEFALEEQVYFIDTVSLSDLPLYTASADIGIQPIENTCLNHFSTDSNKVFEYIMAGLPIVASDLPEIRKLIKSFHLGLLVKPGYGAELVSAIQQLVVDKHARNLFSANAFKAAKLMNWEAQEKQLVNLYEKILSPK